MKPWTAAMTVMAAVIIAVAVVFVLPMDESAGTLWEVSEILHGRTQDSFGKERIGVWRMSLDMAGDHLLFGTGQDTFYYAFSYYTAKNGSALKQVFDTPHNEYIAILTNAGLPALAAYLAMAGTVIICCVRGSRQQPVRKALMAAAVCYMVQAMFSFSVCLVAPMFWCVMGLACGGDTQQSCTDS